MEAGELEEEEESLSIMTEGMAAYEFFFLLVIFNLLHFLPCNSVSLKTAFLMAAWTTFLVRHGNHI